MHHPPSRPSDAETVSSLKKIVSDFNRAFASWREETGCEANFSWSYQEGGKNIDLNIVAKLDLAGVDRVLYRREAPSSQLIEGLMAEAKEAAVRGTD